MKCKITRCHAACCYNVPFFHGELERYADKIVTPVKSIARTVAGAVLPFTNPSPMMNRCPFLRVDNLCNIYDHRPDVCRKMGQIEELPCEFRK